MGQTSAVARPPVRLVTADREGNESVITVLGHRFLIGRSESCQLRSRNPLVSRQHAAIEDDGDAVLLRDLGSRNGTLRNGRPVSGPVPLRDGDRIQVGPLAFTVSIPPLASEPDGPSSAEDQVASWLLDDPSPPPAGAGRSGGSTTDIGVPDAEKRRSLRPS